MTVGTMLKARVVQNRAGLPEPGPEVLAADVAAVVNNRHLVYRLMAEAGECVDGLSLADVRVTLAERLPEIWKRVPETRRYIWRRRYELDGQPCGSLKEIAQVVQCAFRSVAGHQWGVFSFIAAELWPASVSPDPPA